jgi:hypothetical protein
MMVYLSLPMHFVVRIAILSNVSKRIFDWIIMIAHGSTQLRGYTDRLKIDKK